MMAKANQKGSSSKKKSKKKFRQILTVDIHKGGKTTKIRFLEPMPSFCGKDGRVYGPFKRGNYLEIELPIARLLIRKGRAEEI